MPKLDFGAAVRRVIVDEVSIRLAPYRELLDRLSTLVDRAEAVRASAPPSRLKVSQLPLPPAVEQALLPTRPPAAPAREIVVRRLPSRPARGTGMRRRRAEAPEPPPAPEVRVEAVKPFVRRKARIEAVNGATAEPAFDPLDVKVARRYFVGQSVRYRAADGLVTAKIAAIDSVTGVLTLTNPKDESKLTIPAGNVFAAV